jgi:hypothetical protein
MSTYSTEDYEREAIARAGARDEDDEPGGCECLRLIMHVIGHFYTSVIAHPPTE